MDVSGIQSQISTLLEGIESTELGVNDQEDILSSLLDVQFVIMRSGTTKPRPRKRPRVVNLTEANASRTASLRTLYAELREYHLSPPEKGTLLQLMTTYQAAKPHLTNASIKRYHIQKVAGKDSKRQVSMSLDLNASEILFQLIDSFGPKICTILYQKKLLSRLKSSSFADRMKLVTSFQED